MARKLLIAVVAVAIITLGTVTLGTVTSAGASTPTSLSLSQSTAFSILGYWCGGITEQAYVTGTGFDPTSGYPTGAVYLSTTCSSGGRGSTPHTYTAWASATWDFTGAVISAARLASAPTVDPTLTAYDANGNEVYNANARAYLVLAPGYVPAPRVTAISATVGPVSGGTSVIITGDGFTGVTGVSFGTTAASYTFASDTSITAVSPPVTSPGPVDVTVTTGGGPSASTSADVFTFYALPKVSSLSPSSGPIFGGTAVTITGSGFTGASSVAFDGTAVGFVVNSDSSITATAPPWDATDTVAVTVTTPGGTSIAESGSQFTYQAAISLSPTSGPPTTIVSVFGEGFTPGETVKVRYYNGLSTTGLGLCHTVANVNGAFSCAGKISKYYAGALGTHNVVAKGSTSHITATAVFTLT